MTRPDAKTYNPKAFITGIYENDLERYIDHLEAENMQLRRALHGESQQMNQMQAVIQENSVALKKSTSMVAEIKRRGLTVSDDLKLTDPQAKAFKELIVALISYIILLILIVLIAKVMNHGE